MLNASKTQCIFIGNRQILSKLPVNTTISIDNELIIPSSHLKNLGLYLDKNMLFDKHVSEITKKVIGTLMFININSSALDKSSRIIIVQTLALSTTNKRIMSDAPKMHNFAAKAAIGGEIFFDHVTPIIQELGWLKLKGKHVLDTCIVVFKFLSGYFDKWFKDFKTVTGITSSRTRQKIVCLFKALRLTGARSLNVISPQV